MHGSSKKSHAQLLKQNGEHNMATDTPTLFRKLLREGQLYKKSTAGVCPAYIQANVFMIPAKYAADFQRFCFANSGPLPLLFASAEGQFDAPSLTADAGSSDVRTDLPAYKVFEGGNLIATKENLLEFTDLLKHYCFFYVGCSFSFDRILISAGIELRYTDGKGTGNVSMYKTDIMCNKSGSFGVQLVVSMRPVRREMVEKVVEISLPLTHVHGAPVHIGDPAEIGINDLSLDEYYQTETSLQPGEIPLFWACGVTGLEAMKSIESATTFSHCGGSMFITDLKLSNEEPSLSLSDRPKVIWLKEDPPTASVLSEAALNALKQLITDKEDRHGNMDKVGPVCAEEFVQDVLSLSHASTVDIFVDDVPANIEHGKPTKDCLPDSLRMALFLQRLGKSVTCVCESDKCASLKVLVHEMADHDISVAPVAVSTGQEMLDVDEPTRNGHRQSPTRPADIEIEVGAPSKMRRKGIPGLSRLDVETVCRAIYILLCDAIHDRFRRRGLGHPLTDDQKDWFESVLSDLHQRASKQEVQLYLQRHRNDEE